MPNSSIHHDASMKHWDDFMGFIDKLSENKRFSSKKSYRFKLAAEELVSNIIRSSESSFGSTQIMPTLQIAAKEVSLLNYDYLEVVFIDDAPRFDPNFDQLESPIHIEAPVALRPIGGLGLFLVKDSVDSISYKYCRGQNTYTIEMELESAS